MPCLDLDCQRKSGEFVAVEVSISVLASSEDGALPAVIEGILHSLVVSLGFNALLNCFLDRVSRIIDALEGRCGHC